MELKRERDDLVESNVEKNYGDIVDVKQSKSETSVVPASNDTYTLNDEHRLTYTAADLPTRQFPVETSNLVERLRN